MPDTELTKVLLKGDLEALRALGCTVSGPVARTRRAKVKRRLRGEACMVVNVELPWPPALNNLYANTDCGRVLRKPGKAYKHAVLAAVEEQGIEHVVGRLTVEVWAHPPTQRKRDLDGLFKVMLDALGEAGVFEDDSQIDHLSIHRCGVQEFGVMVVQITGEWPV